MGTITWFCSANIGEGYVENCTDPDDSCAYQNYDACGVCDGDGTSCVASLSFGAFDSSGSVEVLYDFGSAVAGFQFDVTGLSGLSASGGAAGDAGFEAVSYTHLTLPTILLV